MSAYLVLIPGVRLGYTVFALTRADALTDAAAYHGLPSCPAGTTAIPFNHPALPLAA